MTHDTPNLGIKLLKYNQAQKETTANEAFIVLDAVANPSAEDILDDLGSANKDGKIYIFNLKLAFYSNGWRYITPKSGWIFWVNSKHNFYTFNGAQWTAIRAICSSCGSPNTT